MSKERDPRIDRIREQLDREREQRKKAEGSEKDIHQQHEPKPDPRPLDTRDIDNDDD
jgi:hypothetical protein